MLRILIIWVIATIYTGAHEHNTLHSDILLLTIMEYESRNDVVNKILGIISSNSTSRKYLWIDVSHTDVEKTTHRGLCYNYERWMCHLDTERHQSSQIQSTHILLKGPQIKESTYFAFLGLVVSKTSGGCLSGLILYGSIGMIDPSLELHQYLLAVTWRRTAQLPCWIPRGR